MTPVLHKAVAQTHVDPDNHVNSVKRLFAQGTEGLFVQD
jgi:hypothetical protein